MRRNQVWEPLRALGMLLGLSVAACGSLIGLGDLAKADCVEDCDVAFAGTATGGVAVAGQSNTGGSTSPGGTGSGGVPVTPEGGTGSSTTSGSGAPPSEGQAGQGGETAVAGCPGGTEPPETWQEHWSGHEQLLKRVHYDDCVAVYFDADVDPATQPWLVKFLHDAWTYSLDAYGRVGDERVYVVVHQGRHLGGHSSTEIEASHDGHSTIDMGQTTWVEGRVGLPAHLLSMLVDSAGAHTKYGAPMGDRYGNDGFPLIYKYDLYLALGYDAYAAAELEKFLTESNDEPSPDTFWLRDWFFPVWRDHGGASVFARYMNLLERYYPAGDDHWMPTMSYGEYFHFMSGAAGVDLVPTAKTAFDWQADFDTELAAAKQHYPDITY